MQRDRKVHLFLLSFFHYLLHMYVFVEICSAVSIGIISLSEKVDAYYKIHLTENLSNLLFDMEINGVKWITKSVK